MEPRRPNSAQSNSKQLRPRSTENLKVYALQKGKKQRHSRPLPAESSPLSSESISLSSTPEPLFVSPMHSKMEVSGYRMAAEEVLKSEGPFMTVNIGESEEDRVGKEIVVGPFGSLPDVSLREIYSPEGSKLKIRSKLKISSTVSLDETVSFTRQRTLPPKDRKEDLKHRKEFEAMMRKYRQKQEKVMRQKEKEKIKKDYDIDQKLKQWRKIMENWSKMKDTVDTKRLWWLGVPPSVRGRVWLNVLGDSLRISSDLFEQMLDKAQTALRDSKSFNETPNQGTSQQEVHHSVHLIEIDAGRTFPSLGLFQPERPLHYPLMQVLQAFVVYRPDLGYVQGMSFVAAMFLLNLDLFDSFKALANLIQRPFFTAFYLLREQDINRYFKVFSMLFAEYLPDLYLCFVKHSIEPQLFLIEWFLSLYARCLPLDIASRVWDCYFLFGEVFVFRTALGILKLFSPDLLNADYDVVVHRLTHVSQFVTEDALFTSIESVQLTSDKYFQLLRSVSV
ncbi:hypothetical protein MP638_006321 [Amoeboaphelidium occidentale]|nr:hypothetical protein MP638_006321 [Amoeboaphelidium occidentale]